MENMFIEGFKEGISTFGTLMGFFLPIMILGVLIIVITKIPWKWKGKGNNNDTIRTSQQRRA